MTANKPPVQGDADSFQTERYELIVVHQVTVFDPNGKGWRTTLRIQDGWQGATISHWSVGGSSVQHGVQKAADHARAALEEGLSFVEAF